MKLGRRSLLQAFVALVAAPSLPKLLPAPKLTGMAAWLPTAGGTFFGVDRSPDTATYLKALWPMTRIEHLAWDDSTLIKALQRMGK